LSVGGLVAGAGLGGIFSRRNGCRVCLPPSSRVIAILKVPSTITTTLAGHQHRRESWRVMVEGSLLSLPLSLAAPLAG